MTPAEVAERVGVLVGLPAQGLPEGARVEVPRTRWVEVARAVRDDPVLDLVLFDVLTAVDEDPDGVDVVLRLWSPSGRHGLLLMARCPPGDLRVPSLTPVFAGAAWHERTVWEMFGVDVEGHPGLVPLLLTDDLARVHPLRKGFVLASRAVAPWPGAVEPGASAGAGRPSRRRRRPPGVPEPGTWPAEEGL